MSDNRDEIYKYISSKLPLNFNTGWRSLSDSESILVDYLWLATLSKNSNSVVAFLHSAKICFGICFTYTQTPYMEYLTDEEGVSYLNIDLQKPPTRVFSETFVRSGDNSWQDTVYEALKSINIADESNNINLIEGSTSIQFDYFTAGLNSLNLYFQSNLFTNQSLVQLHQAINTFALSIRQSANAEYFP